MIAMENALLLVCNENPKVIEGLANLHKNYQETRNQEVN